MPEVLTRVDEGKAQINAWLETRRDAERYVRANASSATESDIQTTITKVAKALWELKQAQARHGLTK